MVDESPDAPNSKRKESAGAMHTKGQTPQTTVVSCLEYPIGVTSAGELTEQFCGPSISAGLARSFFMHVCTAKLVAVG